MAGGNRMLATCLEVDEPWTNSGNAATGCRNEGRQNLSGLSRGERLRRMSRMEPLQI